MTAIQSTPRFGPTSAGHPEHVARKARARTLYEQGVSIAEIGRQMDRSHSQFREWRDTAARHGDPWKKADKPHSSVRLAEVDQESTPALYEHPPAFRCKVEGPHSIERCGYFPDYDREEKRTVQLVQRNVKGRLTWRATCLVRRGLSLKEVARAMEIPASEVWAALPEGYRQSLAS